MHCMAKLKYIHHQEEKTHLHLFQILYHQQKIYHPLSDGKSIIGLQEGVAYFKAISEEGGYTDVCKVVVLNKVVANIEVKNIFVRMGCYCRLHFC